MKKGISILDRAKADLWAAKLILSMATDAVNMDISAYHCQQCIEKTVKFIIGLEGKEYTPRHELYLILEDLENEAVKQLVDPISSIVDGWAVSPRYSNSIRSNVKQIEKIIIICEQLIEIAQSKIPKKEETKKPKK